MFEISSMSLQCHCCSKTFSNRSNLQRHQASVANYRPYECHVCNKTFTRRDVLKRHTIRHFNLNIEDSSTLDLIADESFGRKNEIAVPTSHSYII